MRLYTLEVGNKEFKVAVVSSEADMRKGLSGAKKMKKRHGMLFDFKKSQTVTMNMRNMNYGIDMLFIDPDLKVKNAVSLMPDADDITVDDVRFVLEVNKGEGEGTVNEKVKMCECLLAETEQSEPEPDEKEQPVMTTNIIVRIETVPTDMKEMFKRGGTIKMYEEDIKIDKDKMQVLDDKGRVLMNIAGGERIFSIKHTEALVKMAKKVNAGEASEEELGKLMAEIIEIQNNQKPEYV